MFVPMSTLHFFQEMFELYNELYYAGVNTLFGFARICLVRDVCMFIMKSSVFVVYDQKRFILSNIAF